MKEQQFERGKIVYYIGGLLNEIYEAPYHPKEFTEKYRLAGLAFQTREEAEVTLERVKKALKGDDSPVIETYTKEECLRFFYWWWNQKGNNTEEGFEQWLKAGKT